jgi:hypothetical protein
MGNYIFLRMENLEIQPFEQTLIQEGGGLEVWLPARSVHIDPLTTSLPFYLSLKRFALQ